MKKLHSLLLAGAALCALALPASAATYELRVHAQGIQPTPAPAPTNTCTISQSDPDYAYVTSLMHMDGGNGSTSFVDQLGNPIAVYGSAQIATTQSKWGGASAYFGTSGNDYLSMSDNTNYALGTGDFTIEAWVYPTSSAYSIVLSKYDGSSSARWVLGINNSTGNSVSFTSQPTNSTWTTIYGPSVQLNTWNHIAAVRHNGVITVYTNGVGGTPVSVTDNLTVPGPMGVGRFINAASGYILPYTGYLDDVRMSKGIARYTANFTVPCGAFANNS